MLNKTNLLFTVLLAAIITFGLSCTSKPTLPIDKALSELEQKLAKTPRSNQEAEEMALWISNDLTAPDELYDLIDTSLLKIRKKFSSTIPVINSTNFLHPIPPSYVLAILTDSAASMFQDSLYTEWDSLNEIYGLEKIKPSWSFQSLHWISLSFKGNVNSDSLVAYYNKLDGISEAFPNGYLGDRPGLYPWIREDGKLTFLLREAWGDCPAGCIYSYFWYFVEDEFGWELIGEWEYQRINQPDWWEEAKVGYERYRGFK